MLGSFPGPAGGAHGEAGGAIDAPFSRHLAAEGAERVEVVYVAATGVVGSFEIGHHTGLFVSGQKDEEAGDSNRRANGFV